MIMLGASDELGRCHGLDPIQRHAPECRKESQGP